MTRHNGPRPVEPGSGVRPCPPFGGTGDRSGANASGDEPGNRPGNGRRKPGRPAGQAPISDEQASGELTGLWDIPWDRQAKEWDRQLRKDYGLPGWLWREIAAEQEHRCPLCLTPMAGARKRFPLDHDHDPARAYELFGLPCDGCNRLLDSGFRERVLAYLTDPPARRVGLRLYGRPLRVPRVRAERLEAKRAKRAAGSRQGTARTTRAASRVRRAAQARTTAETPAVPAATEAPDFSSQLQALMGRAALNQTSNQMEGRS